MGSNYDRIFKDFRVVVLINLEEERFQVNFYFLALIDFSHILHKVSSEFVSTSHDYEDIKSLALEVIVYVLGELFDSTLDHTTW